MAASFKTIEQRDEYLRSLRKPPTVVPSATTGWEWEGVDMGVCRHCGDVTCVYDDPIPTCCADCSRSGCED